MNHEGLIETLFLKAAHTLATRSPDEETAARWRLLAYTYKQKCLEKAIEATRREGLLASDSTISLIVSIAFDEVSLNDCIHNDTQNQAGSAELTMDVYLI